MALSHNQNVTPRSFYTETIHYAFPTTSQLETTEQIRRFELLRLAFFALKLRKLDEQGRDVILSELRVQQREFRRNLLHHVIFQQIVTLTKLGAREQALQLIDACRQ